LYKVLIVILIFMLSGCSIENPKQNDIIPFTEDEPKVVVPEENQGDTTEEELQEDFIPSEENTEPNPDTAIEPEITPQEQDSLQQPTPEDEVNPEQEPIEPPVVSTNLPFLDFKERWNAISDEQFSNLYIKTLSKADGEDYYRAMLTSDLELRVVVQAEYIQRLEMISSKKTETANQQMLTGWNQIINILQPNIETYDVDSLFHQIGVGPNADLSNVTYMRFTYSSIQYEVKPTSTGYIFRGFYHLKN
jgi:negative regulator of genetic competence, sporulation and motility